MKILKNLINELEKIRLEYIEKKDKALWYALIQLLPSSYNQMRTCTLNYETLVNIYKSRKNELDGYTLDNTSSCSEYVGYREILHKKWDNELNQIYKLLMSKYPESQKTALRNEERAWIKKREKSMDSIASEMNGCMGAAVTIVNSEIDTIKSRAIELARRYDGL